MLRSVEVASASISLTAAARSSDVVASDDAVFLNDLLNLPQPPELRPIYEQSRGSSLMLGCMSHRRRRPSRTKPAFSITRAEPMFSTSAYSADAEDRRLAHGPIHNFGEDFCHEALAPPGSCQSVTAIKTVWCG